VVGRFFKLKDCPWFDTEINAACECIYPYSSSSHPKKPTTLQGYV